MLCVPNLAVLANLVWLTVVHGINLCNAVAWVDRCAGTTEQNSSKELVTRSFRDFSRLNCTYKINFQTERLILLYSIRKQHLPPLPPSPPWLPPPPRRDCISFLPASESAALTAAKAKQATSTSTAPLTPMLWHCRAKQKSSRPNANCTNHDGIYCCIIESKQFLGWSDFVEGSLCRPGL